MFNNEKLFDKFLKDLKSASIEICWCYKNIELKGHLFDNFFVVYLV